MRARRRSSRRALPGQTFGEVYRHAKMLFFPLESGDYIALVVHAMLAGRYQYVEPETKAALARRLDATLDNGMELRYFDERRMGRAYMVAARGVRARRCRAGRRWART